MDIALQMPFGDRAKQYGCEDMDRQRRDGYGDQAFTQIRVRGAFTLGCVLEITGQTCRDRDGSHVAMPFRSAAPLWENVI
ncbi:hypothetical protein CUV01_15350 [Paracoccus tegillarcae]|uniref:Uncharacterized protein n=1 Tax=Paracoccus tegillarcae TaxID=1529068 RepID=A0A2K9EHX1_9RHOB|nr:hypothetical protein CUV01_15350 [Paracoccus tegillarcae]